MTLMDYPLFHGWSSFTLHVSSFRSSSSGVHFFYTVQAVSGVLCNLLLYSTRPPTWSIPVGGRVEYNKRLHSMPETACTV